MKMRYRYLNGMNELVIEAQTEGEECQIEKFAVDGDTIIGKIYHNKDYKYPLIILQKVES